jgi:DNA helicase II / ATP-dependent DNA helicase PcrA
LKTLFMDSIVIAAAGGGKTTKIVGQALAASAQRCALITYTQNNVAEITRKFYQSNRSVPLLVEVWSWYSFLLRELARPYQLALTPQRVQGIQWTQKRSTPYTSQADIERFYFDNERNIYSDKIAQFVCACNEASNGAVIRRLEQRFDRIFIDEVQDLAGYDLDLVELILRSRVELILVGDHRQATFRTNNFPKNSAYSGIKIVNKFREWRDAELCDLTYQVETCRCNQQIADIADSFFPEEPRTKSLSQEISCHQGVFVVSSTDVDQYVRKYRPQVLRLDVKTDCLGYQAMNFVQGAYF